MDTPDNPPTDRPWLLAENCGEFSDHCGNLYGSFTDLDQGEAARFGFRVQPFHCNLRPICHGGMLATFLDVAMARGLRYGADINPPLATISMTLDYIGPAPLGSWIEARVCISKVTRSLAFVQAMIHADNTPVLRGSAVFRHYVG